MLVEDYIRLDWDSNFFGFNVAKIPCTYSQPDSLGELLENLRRDGVKLAYWPTDPENHESQEAAVKKRGFLADKKVTFVINLTELKKKDLNLSKRISLYKETEPNDELYSLAIQSGLYSRFIVDPNFSSECFEKLYTQWMKNSTNKTLAKGVFVAKEKGKIVGMVTVGEKRGRAEIGLIAVDARVRGRGFGRELVQAAIHWAKTEGYSEAQVITQLDNTAACHLYERSGYKIEKVQYLYHFWLS